MIASKVNDTWVCLSLNYVFNANFAKPNVDGGKNTTFVMLDPFMSNQPELPNPLYTSNLHSNFFSS